MHVPVCEYVCVCVYLAKIGPTSAFASYQQQQLWSFLVQSSKHTQIARVVVLSLSLCYF